MSNIKCAICGRELENKFGNNPYPIVEAEGARCCNVCNDNFVIPARIDGINSIEKEISKEEGVKVLYTIDKLKEMFKSGELKSNIYTSKNEEGCDVLVIVQEGVGFDIHTNQANGWIRVDSYDYDAENDIWSQGESYEGKWK